ncbi:MAG TPA: radical SAM protein [Thermoleophilia bacterium]|nr:radical SAM protein [Thermoleophilia bacterium]
MSDGLVYGPVPSRRLGRSLGVDLVPFKTCTFDCIYCQLGRTTDRTTQRARWHDPDEVLAQICAHLRTHPDVIALAGSGEPTLADGIGEVVDGIKSLTDIPLAVITNGSLLGDATVQRDLRHVDIILPSLDAVDEQSFRTINRPHGSISFNELVDGLISFRAAFSGRVWLEIMLLDGHTATEARVEKLAALAARIQPDKVQLNTVARPPAEPQARPVTPERLAGFADAFTPPAEVVAGAPEPQTGCEATAADVLALVRRRPCTAADVAAGLGMHRNEALKALSALVDTGELRSRNHDGRAYYAAADGDSRGPEGS